MRRATKGFVETSLLPFMDERPKKNLVLVDLIRRCSRIGEEHKTLFQGSFSLLETESEQMVLP